jgi:hypothetical protein
MSRRLPGTFANLRHVIMNCLLGITGLAVLISSSSANEPAIPILAWSGPPANETNVERYRELAEAGFTHNFSSFANADAMQQALDVAHAAGIKQFISIPELQSAPEKVAERFKGHPALAGYYLRDEPSAADFPALAAWAKRVQAVDANHLCYLNLFPNYANPGQLGTATYKEHLDRFIREVPVPFISFDHYPVVGKASVRGEWYENLELVSAAAKAAKKPFWAFALAVAHDPYPIAQIEHLRLQVFSNLAYGAQGIQYFTYWTVKSPHWNFHEAPIDAEGKRTAVYDRVKKVNAEIRALSNLFAGAEVLQVGHTGTLPRGTRAYEPASPIATLKTENGGAVVSLLANSKRRILAIVNRDLHANLPLAVTFLPDAKIREVTKEREIRPVAAGGFNADLSPGDIRVLTWDAAP